MQTLIIADGAELHIEPDASTLSFADRCLGDDGVCRLCSVLASHQCLVNLNLRGCHIHSSGAAGVGQLLLGGASTLRALSLEWNAVGTCESGVLSIAKALAANETLTQLDLRNNRISAVGVTASYTPRRQIIRHE